MYTVFFFKHGNLEIISSTVYWSWTQKLFGHQAATAERKSLHQADDRDLAGWPAAPIAKNTFESYHNWLDFDYEIGL